MKYGAFVIIFIVFFFTNLLSGYGKVKEQCTHSQIEVHDSILNHIFTYAPVYSRIINEYWAELYVRGVLKVHKRNHLIRYVPSMFRFDKKVKEYITETVGEVHYTSPDVYDMKMHALIGTFHRNKGELGNTMEYFNMNVYSPTLLPGKLISPLDRKGSSYYYYKVDSICAKADSIQYYIHIIPKNKSTQLVSGYMVVNDGIWTISEIALKGRADLITFDAKLIMGEVGDEVFLPKRFNVNLMFSFLGNKIEGDYSATMDYQSIIMRKMEENKKLKENHNLYDLTDSYRLKCDQSRVTEEDTAYMAQYRPYPLTDEQKKLYTDFNERKKEFEQTTTVKKRKSLVFFGELGDALISNYTIDLSSLGSVRCSPLINPFLLSYSHSNGFSYRQEFKYNRLFLDDSWVRVVPKLGYNFTQNEFYWSIGLDYFYWPQRIGAFRVKVGNGNRIYTSKVIDEIKNLPDSLLDFDKLHLDYFRDAYIQLGHQVELANGLELMTGISVHRRTAVRKSELVLVDTLETGKVVKLRPTYVSFAPRLQLSWTPGLHYYMNGKRKINLYSYYPTFSLDYERGIKGVFGSTSSYERIEFDMQQKISLSLMSQLSYRIGTGAFTDQKEVYFVDFMNFSRSNLPVGWNDDIGGVFQLLDSRWYNSSRWYLRGHLTYEAPFLVLPHVKKYTRLIDSERLYISALYEERLSPYIEFGYGIGTHIFDMGVFINNINGKFNEIGCKFTFELFNR